MITFETKCVMVIAETFANICDVSVACSKPQSQYCKALLLNKEMSINVTSCDSNDDNN